MEIPKSLPARKIDLSASRIPRVIYQTFKTNDVPEAMFKAVSSWIEKNLEYAYQFFDDAELYAYVRGFTCDGFSFASQDLATAIDRIKPGAGKADLFRYLLIYERGGVYMDIDSFCINPLNRFVAPEDDVVTGLGERGDFHQWGLIYCPKHPFLKRTIENAVHNILHKSFVPGFANKLEGIAGPPCLDMSIKQVLKQPPHGRFTPGAGTAVIEGRPYKMKLLAGDFFAGNVGFKYDGYKADLQSLGVSYWMDDALFND